MLRAPQKSQVGEDFRRSKKQSPDPMTYNLLGILCFKVNQLFLTPSKIRF